MKILLLAPQPFYQERGTPIAVDTLLRALSERGARVDLLTYHEGRSPRLPGLTIHRIVRLPLVQGIRPGFSVQKLACDLVLTLKTVELLRHRPYDVIHAVEEAVYPAMLLGRLMQVPYVYDMDSSLAEQMALNYRLCRITRPWFARMEALAVRRAHAVAAVCPALVELAHRCGARHVAWLPDPSLLPEDYAAPLPDATSPRAPEPAGRPPLTVTYVGSLDPHQGLGLLLEAFARARRAGLNARLEVIGGRAPDVARLRRLAAAMGLGAAVRFGGPRPVARLGDLLAAADILVSPRIQGSNVPMKISSYLHAGRPIVATRLPMHTQVLDDDTALLCPASPDGLAAALLRLAADAPLRARLGREGRRRAETVFSYRRFRQRLDRLYDYVENEIGDLS